MKEGAISTSQELELQAHHNQSKADLLSHPLGWRQQPLHHRPPSTTIPCTTQSSFHPNSKALPGAGTARTSFTRHTPQDKEELVAEGSSYSPSQPTQPFPIILMRSQLRPLCSSAPLLGAGHGVQASVAFIDSYWSCCRSLQVTRES